MDKHLHIVSFDVPWPADYGGVIDVYYKAKALAEQGVKVHLHCFAYGRAISPHLADTFHEVHYYKRNMNKTLLAHPLPFIMISRQSSQLLKRLLEDDYPILFEGKHSCYLLDHPDLVQRECFVRTHNVETDYYSALAKRAGIFKRWYFQNESKKLKRYSPHLSSAEALFCITKKDATHFSEWNEAIELAAFHSAEGVKYKSEKSPFALYHGNLAVSENDEAAHFLVNKVFANSEKTLHVFGHNAPRQLKKAIAQHENMYYLKSGDLLSFIQTAQVNVLPTFQTTGLKLKLLYSLFNGGHVVVNRQMVEGTCLANLCHVATSAQEMREIVDSLWEVPFTEADAKKRESFLVDNFSNEKNAGLLIERIFNHKAKSSSAES